jgi:hypothetical protein
MAGTNESAFESTTTYTLRGASWRCAGRIRCPVTLQFPEVMTGFLINVAELAIRSRVERVEWEWHLAIFIVQ